LTLAALRSSFGKVRGIRRRLGWAGVSAACVFLVAAASASGHVKPKPGTYSGAGSMIGDASYGMELAFGFDGATATFKLVGFGAPNCSGYTSVFPAPVAKHRFKATGSNSDRSVVITGRWVTPQELTGRMKMTVVPGAMCGTPGTYEYKFSAKRYGAQ
jgi:hypothetical protein